MGHLSHKGMLKELCPHTILRQHYIATRISRSAIVWSVSPCSSLRASRKVQREGLVHCTKDLNPRCQPSAMLDDLGKPARAESC